MHNSKKFSPKFYVCQISQKLIRQTLSYSLLRHLSTRQVPDEHQASPTDVRYVVTSFNYLIAFLFLRFQTEEKKLYLPDSFILATFLPNSTERKSH